MRGGPTATDNMRVECEVQSLEQLEEALEGRADGLLLDDFDDAMGS